MPTIILIAGPTASGKSALALTLVEAVGGTIVNADSMQVYRDLRIITARPSIEDERRAPHLLYGHVDAADNYSVGRWSADTATALAKLKEQDGPAILVGGTGLYFKALTHGLAAMPPVPEAIHAEIRSRLREEGVAALYAELARRDPAGAARLRPADRSRVSRALEVVVATGRSIVDWQERNAPPIVALESTAKVFLAPPRETLRRAIDSRFDAMLAGGALEEARAFASRRLDPTLPAMKAHGVPWLIRHLDGEITLEEAAEGAKRDTRQYTKRQATWFRNQLPGFQWVVPADARAAIEAQLDKLGR